MAATVSPKDTFHKVLFSEVYADESRNPRVDYSDCEPNSQFDPAKYFSDVDVNKYAKPDATTTMSFYEDVTMNGILVPVDVAELTSVDVSALKKITGKTYKYRVIRGHRRMHVLTYAQKYHKEWFKPGGKFYEIPVHIHKGLTYDQEMNLLIDQFGVKSLNAPEVYRAIRSLHGLGLTFKEIAARVHMSYGFVQRRIWITTFPEFVYNAWVDYVLKRGDENTRVNLTDTRLVALNKAANLDWKAKVALDSDGSEFMKAWNKILKPSTSSDGSGEGSGEPNDGPSDNKQKMMTRSDIEAFIKKTGLDDVITSILKLVLRESDRGLDAINNECIVLRKKAEAYDDVNKSKSVVVKAKSPKSKKA